MMNNDRGRGATGPKKPNKIVDRYCISPQLAPSVLTPSEKRMFAETEAYHDSGKAKGGRK